MNNELQNPNEAKCVPATYTNLYVQISQSVNGMSHQCMTGNPLWVPVNNVKSKQRNKRKRSNKAKLSRNANGAELHQPTKERNQISHQNSNAAQQNPSTPVSCGNPSITRSQGKLVFIAGDSLFNTFRVGN